MSPPYPLNQRLPAPILGNSWWNYNTFNFPVYSWSWFGRYAALMGPVGVMFGTVWAARIVRIGGDSPLVMQAAIRTGTVWLGIALLAPALGCWIRHRGFDFRRERQLLIASILVAIGALWLGRVWYQNYLLEVVSPALLAEGHSIAAVFPGQRKSQLFSEVGFWILALWGSIEPYHAYYAELRRWKRYTSSRDMELARQQRDTADLRLAVLQAQVEPHFLYNTMASVRSLVRSDPDRAEATIDALVDHLRATVPKIRDDQSALSTLSNQIDVCRSYLEVMRVRMGGRFSYSIDIAPEVTLVPFPPLMLLSLVENAIKHGIELKPGGCSIRIVAQYRDDRSKLEVCVDDDGAGLREGPSEGIGLANIRSQLNARYGSAASLSLVGNQQGGTTATIRIPVEVVST